MSSLWDELSQMLGTRLNHTSSYHPQSNGMVERFHRHLKDVSRARLAGFNWVNHLPWVLLGVRCTPKEDSRFSPAQLLYGTSLRVPGTICESYSANTSPNILFRELQENFKEYVPMSTQFHGHRSSFVHPQLHSSSYVWIRVDRVRRPLEAPYNGPFKVIQKQPKQFLCDVDGHRRWISIDRLKPSVVNIPFLPDVVVTRSGRHIKPPDRYQSG